MNKEDQESGFISHLTELRKRLIHSFLFLVVFFVCCYFFAENLYGFLVDPFAQAVKDDGTSRRLIFTALQSTPQSPACVARLWRRTSSVRSSRRWRRPSLAAIGAGNLYMQPRCPLFLHPRPQRLASLPQPSKSKATALLRGRRLMRLCSSTRQRLQQTIRHQRSAQSCC